MKAARETLSRQPPERNDCTRSSPWPSTRAQVLDMTDPIESFVRRSVAAHQEGKYTRALPPNYRRNMRSGTVDEVAQEILSDADLRRAYEVAFQEYPPLDTEIFVSTLPDCIVMTDRRIFQLDRDRLLRPPISLARISKYEGFGFWRRREVITLVDGMRIERKTGATLGKAFVQKFVQMAKDAPDLKPIGIGMSPALESLVNPIANDEKWLCLGVFETVPEHIDRQSAFNLWLNRAVFGVLGDALTPRHRVAGVAAVAESGRLYLAPVGVFSENEEIRSLFRDAIIDVTSVTTLQMPRTSARWESSSLVVGSGGQAFSLRFPSCFVPDNEMLGTQIERAIYSFWKA